MTKPALTLHHGGKDVVEILERMLERAKAGELEAVLIAWIEPSGYMANTWAYRDDMPIPWVQLQASAAHLHHVLMTEGL